ncbi:hypothetical protein BCR44DRAFT_1444941 [Catenaria anguillulae PL171]|uniref:Uncharacterized protein n=1 Tax=Catenaria anguillulae PL171 TaxID=765915 RepID=A0A1Y2H712_9FUNG|nr:hypothetical protein BCR44DRAFT_1444941 [Catenaria anguillulae PL171]
MRAAGAGCGVVPTYCAATSSIHTLPPAIVTLATSASLRSPMDSGHVPLSCEPLVMSCKA